ncbi:MAG: hypothetical protein IKK93_08985, partial [Campylobacter sp.]|nr:hypothetical protein [Campylobacter sp.]
MRYKKLNEISKSFKNELNQLYKDMDNPIILNGLKIANLTPTNTTKLAMVSRIVDLKFQGIENELKKLGKTKEQISNVESNLYDFVSKFYIDRFSNLLKQIKDEDILTPFEMALLEGIHNIGIAITNMQKIWHKHIICDINKEFESKFDTIG